MKLVTAPTAALFAIGSAGMYAYAQTRPDARVAQTEPRDRNALERLRDWVMERGDTERANEYWDHHKTGIYVEARTGKALFASH